MPTQAVGGHIPGSVSHVLLMNLDSPILFTLILALALHLMLKLPKWAKGVEILKTSLPSWNPGSSPNTPVCA